MYIYYIYIVYISIKYIYLDTINNMTYYKNMHYR